MPHARWLVTIHFRVNDGILLVDHAVEEIEDLQDIVERGPDWNTIDKIEIVLAEPYQPTLTVEEAAKQ
jgi:hypothetical protein